MRQAVPAWKKLELVEYFLASASEYRTISNLFGVLRVFLCNCFKEICCVIIKNLQKSFICILIGDGLHQSLKWKVVVLYVCRSNWQNPHTHCCTRGKSHIDYVNRKGYHNVVENDLPNNKKTHFTLSFCLQHFSFIRITSELAKFHFHSLISIVRLYHTLHTFSLISRTAKTCLKKVITSLATCTCTWKWWEKFIVL